MRRVIHFELGVDDIRRATEFYHEVFGWNITKKTLGDEDYWLIHTGTQDERGINGGMKKREKNNATMGAITTIDVPSVKDFLEKISKAGGKIIQKSRALPGTGYLAYCEDPEGNLFAILQYDSTVR